jgi:hydroxymethylbilane synthase
MSHKILRIGTRDSELAVWQATLVKNLLHEHDIESQLVFIKSEGDLDTITPLYALGVQGVFTRSLDAALLAKKIDLAVHSMKDVPTQLAKGIIQAAVLKRASHKDILVYKNPEDLNTIGFINHQRSAVHSIKLPFKIATSSIRRIAQWIHRYPTHKIENLRGNVNTRLRKLKDSDWNGAIFAAAGLERIHLRPENSVDLDWMLPAPAQGAIMIACREKDDYALQSTSPLNDNDTALCTKLERDFLSTLMGGCSTPISALAEMNNNELVFQGNIVSANGKQVWNVSKKINKDKASEIGVLAAQELLANAKEGMISSLKSSKLS